jgi:hypothetical protein
MNHQSIRAASLQRRMGNGSKPKLRAEGPTSFETQEAAYATGGVNGWHSHPCIAAQSNGSMKM